MGEAVEVEVQAGLTELEGGSGSWRESLLLEGRLRLEKDESGRARGGARKEKEEPSRRLDRICKAY